MDKSPNPSRYHGKPLLRIIECYVLWVVGQLPQKEAQAMADVTLKLQQLYKTTGTWQEVISKVMEFPPTMPEMIRGLWVKNAAIAKANNVKLSPQQFAEMFVDQNLAS
jgi:hypothetical protein